MSAPKLHQYPFTPCSLTMDGHRLSYLDQGKGPALVMVHGNPSWSYLYRNLVSHLQGRYRCIVPDHLGCGLSDKPQNYPYRLQNHIHNLDHLLDRLEISQCTLIVHDWGGAIGMGWAGRHPERVKGLVILNSAAFFSPRIPLRIAICRIPLLGALLVRGVNGFARAAIHMAVHKPMDPRVAAGFLYPYDSWHNRVAIYGFVRDIPMAKDHPSAPALAEVEAGLTRLHTKKMLICWGGRDFCFTRHFYEQWRQRFPRAQAHFFPHAGHYVLEDALPEILPLLDPFIDKCHDQ